MGYSCVIASINTVARTLRAVHELYVQLAVDRVQIPREIPSSVLHTRAQAYLLAIPV